MRFDGELSNVINVPAGVLRRYLSLLFYFYYISLLCMWNYQRI